MRRILIFGSAGLAFLMVLTVFIGLFFAAHFYFTIFSEGVQSDYISIAKNKNHLLDASTFELKEKRKIGQSIWKMTHFQNFLIPAPFSHPLVYVGPNIKNRHIRNDLGLYYYSSSGATIFSFFERKPMLFKTELDRNKLFSIPFVQSAVYSKSTSQIFKDTFSRSIFFGNKTVPELSNAMIRQILSTSWRDLVYNLFIYKLRQNYFDYKNIESIKFYEGHNLGVISFLSNSSNEKKELYFYLHDNLIYTIEVEYKTWSALAKKVRKKFLGHLEFRPTTKDISVEIYGNYRTMVFEKQFGHDGMIYLLSAWSHHQEDKKFLKELIQRLERGKSSSDQLRLLYRFALDKYGETFSSKEEVSIQDHADKRIEKFRKQEEIRKNEEEEKSSKSSYELESMDFESSDKKMDYFLEEAIRKEND